MGTKFMTWSLHAPSTLLFNEYYKLADGEPWYSKNYQLVNASAMDSWDYRKRSFVEMIQKYTKKFYAIGCHQFGVNYEGKIFNIGNGGTAYNSLVLNDYKTATPKAATIVSTPTATTLSGNLTINNIDKYEGPNRSFYIRKFSSTKFVTNRYTSAESDVVFKNNKLYMDGLEIIIPSGTQVNDRWDIVCTEQTLTKAVVRPTESSLLYLMHNYPQIKWSLQFLATQDRVSPILWNDNGEQNTFIEQCYEIMNIYIQKGFPIKGVEIDFERTNSSYTYRNEDNVNFANFLSRVKNEVCIPLGVELRVNLYAMTGDSIPSYYKWHDYRTVASAKDKNGNQAVDEFQTMSYDFSWGGSAPGPSTPLDWLQQQLDHIKNLEKDDVLDPAKVFIGNAGYGRRWPLGEWDIKKNDDRQGSTMDYKQLMLAQNGCYIHNSGYDDPDGWFYFNDQDFVPFSGFNDAGSDYQRTFFHVYDRFNLTKNGGAIFPDNGEDPKGNFVNLHPTKKHATNYSRRQHCVFGGVQTSIFKATSYTNDTNLVKSTVTPSDTIANIKRASGISFPADIYEYLVELDSGVEGNVTYQFNASGSKRLIALVRWPFFDQADIYFTLNGNQIHINGNQYDWNPFMQAQETHFVDLGVQDFSGTNTISIGNTRGAFIYGFVVCDTFNYNLYGGEITFPTSIFPMKTRGAQLSDGTITMKDAQYPDYMRLVGEVLLRPPRPAIIWEDIWTSYVGEDSRGQLTEQALTTTLRYYSRTDDTDKQGYSVGTDWKVYVGDDGFTDYAKANAENGQKKQLVLNQQFSSNIAVELLIKSTSKDGIYGIRLFATNHSIDSGYLCLLDFKTNKIKLYWEVPNQPRVEVASADMTDELLAIGELGTFTVRAYVLNGKLSFWVDKKRYLENVVLANKPVKGAHGVYIENCTVKLYKYNISTLDRWERMNRMEIVVDGQTYVFDSVPLKDGLVYDEFGYIVYSALPAEVADKVSDTGGDSGSDVDDVLVSNSIAAILADPNFKWSTDYKNKALAVVPSWQGRKNIIVRFKDAGIWFRNFYVGDDQGMSVAYNSDKVGFIKTANLVAENGCKGIAMWTLGQEDPTIYTYIPDGDES